MAIVQEGLVIQSKEGLTDIDQSFTGTGDLLGTNVSITPISHGSRFKVTMYIPTHANSEITGSNQNPYWGARIFRRINGGAWTIADMLGTDTRNRQAHAEISPYRNAPAGVLNSREGTRFRSKANYYFIIDRPDYTVGDLIEYKIQIWNGNARVFIGAAHQNSSSYFNQPYGLIVDEISGGFIPNPDIVHDGLTPEKAAPSAKYIKNATGTTTSGLYWILINGFPTQLYCDMSTMDGGGWTLIGKSGGGAWHDPDGWLKSNINVSSLQNTNYISTNTYACVDARVLASCMATECLLSNNILDRWVKCPFHSQCSPGTIFNHKLTQSVIFETVNSNMGSENVTATAWNGSTTSSWVNKFSVMALSSHGGSTPAWTINTQGNTSTNDFAMAVACATTNHNGFTAGTTHNGQDAPFNTTWPNASFNSGHFLGSVWVR